MKAPFSRCCLLAAILVPCAFPTWAWQVQNRVTLEHGPLTLDHSKTVAEITQAQGRGGFPASHGLGLYQSRIKTELTLAPVEAAAPRRLSLTTRITTAPIIYVASEFPKDSCGYGVILAHERQHHLFDLEVLRTLPAEVDWITREVFPLDVLARDGSVNAELSRRHFFQQFKYRYDELSNLRHQTIDNPDSYRRLGDFCKGEIAKRLAGRSP
jgi:hypothetical protein